MFDQMITKKQGWSKWPGVHTTAASLRNYSRTQYGLIDLVRI